MPYVVLVLVSLLVVSQGAWANPKAPPVKKQSPAKKNNLPPKKKQHAGAKKTPLMAKRGRSAKKKSPLLAKPAAKRGRGAKKKNSTPAKKNAPLWQSEEKLYQAYRAMEQGKLPQGARLLQEAAALLKKEQSRMPSWERLYLRLSLALAQSQIQQTLSQRFLQAKQDKAKKADLVQQVLATRQSIRHLYKAQAALKRYRELYLENLQRLKPQNKSSQLALLHLQKRLRSALEDQQAALSTLQLRLNEETISDKAPPLPPSTPAQGAREKKVARLLQQMHHDYLKAQQGLSSRGWVATPVLWSGVGLAVLGFATGVIGAVFLLHLEIEPTGYLLKEPSVEPGSLQAVSRSRSYQVHVGYVLLGVGLGVLVAGGGVALTGLLLRPGARERERVVLQNHNLFLDKVIQNKE